MPSSTHPYAMYICSYMHMCYGCVEAMTARHLQCITPSRMASFHSDSTHLLLRCCCLSIGDVTNGVPRIY